MIPKTFEIIGATWRVRKTKNLKDTHGRPCHGLCHTDKRLIEIDSDAFCDYDLLVHTWKHELNHAIWWSLGFDFWDDEDKVDLDGGVRAQVIKSSKGVLS